MSEDTYQKLQSKCLLLLQCCKMLTQCLHLPTIQEEILDGDIQKINDDDDDDDVIMQTLIYFKQSFAYERERKREEEDKHFHVKK